MGEDCVEDIEAWYLHDGRDMGRVLLVGSEAIIILPPLATTETHYLLQIRRMCPD